MIQHYCYNQYSVRDVAEDECDTSEHLEDVPTDFLERTRNFIPQLSAKGPVKTVKQEPMPHILIQRSGTNLHTKKTNRYGQANTNYL